MALYEDVFQSKGAVFTIRNAGPQDAQAMLDYMGCVDRETTFLAREPGEFERGFTLEKERAYLAGCQESSGELFLLAVTAQDVVAGSSHCSFRLAADHFLGGGVKHFNPFAGTALNELAVDVHFEIFHKHWF